MEPLIRSCQERLRHTIQKPGEEDGAQQDVEYQEEFSTLSGSNVSVADRGDNLDRDIEGRHESPVLFERHHADANGGIQDKGNDVDLRRMPHVEWKIPRQGGVLVGL